MAFEKINGVNLFYNITGNGNEVVVFLNGVGMTTQSWDPMLAYFQEYKCLVTDFRGQLLSEIGDEEYTMEMHAHDTAALLKKLGIEKAHFIGTSYGSEISMLMAIHYPEMVQTISVLNGVSELDGVLYYAVKTWQEAARVHNGEVFVYSLLPWSYSPEFIANNKPFIEERINLVTHVPVKFYDGFVKLCDAFLKMNITAELKKIKCPAMIIAAELDNLKRPLFSQIIHENIAGSEYRVVPKSGHAMVYEKPKEASELCLSIIKKNKI